MRTSVTASNLWTSSADIRFRVGWPDFHLKAYFSRASPEAGVWLSCRGDNGFANYEDLEAHRAEIERAMGGP